MKPRPWLTLDKHFTIELHSQPPSNLGQRKMESHVHWGWICLCCRPGRKVSLPQQLKFPGISERSLTPKPSRRGHRTHCSHKSLALPLWTSHVITQKPNHPLSHWQTPQSFPKHIPWCGHSPSHKRTRTKNYPLTAVPQADSATITLSDAVTFADRHTR